MTWRTGRSSSGAALLAVAVALACGTALAQGGSAGQGRHGLGAPLQDDSQGVPGVAADSAWTHPTGLPAWSDAEGPPPAMIPVHGYRGRHRSGAGFVFIAPGPFYDPFFYPFGPAPYAWYPPPVVAVPSAPPAYIERTPAAPPPSRYWYWCADPPGYYPTVQTCPGGWQAVAPRPGGG